MGKKIGGMVIIFILLAALVLSCGNEGTEKYQSDIDKP